jgi:glycosyltransferase involved in cell wall biosynthesis
VILGLLPEIRGGLGELARTGQLSRFIDGYLRPYARVFDETRYFSYLAESLADYTDDPRLRDRVRVYPGGRWHPWVHALVMPFRHRRALAGCSVLRVYQVTGVIPAVLAKRLLGVPFVTTYGFWYTRLARSRSTRRLRQIAERLGLRAADAVIVTTDELAAHIAGRVPDRTRVHLIPNGVDVDLFRPVPRVARGRRRILFVGRLSAEKNLETLVRAVAKLCARFDLELVLVGEGPVRARLESDAARAGVPLVAPGVVDHRALPELYASADVFVLPSTTEGHPKVLLEAMSAGTPCVASDLPASRSILDEGRAGLLVDPRDADAFAVALERVLGDDALARDLAERGRARVVERYDLATLVSREIDLLKRVASRAGDVRGGG